MAISNQYKDTLNDFIDSSDLKPLNWTGSIYKTFLNALRSKGNLADLLEKDYLDNNFSNKSLLLIPKTENLQVRCFIPAP